jgi:hypothetical protein
MRTTTTTTNPDGSTTVTRSKTSCGCFTAFLVLLVLGIPAVYFGAWAIPAYVVLGILAVLAGVGWLTQRVGHQP